MSVRVCIVGNGAFANRIHYPVLASLSDVEIVGISAFRPEQLAATAKVINLPPQNIFQATSPASFQDMVRELQPDGVYAIGQPSAMFGVWTWCLTNRVNLFIEKPMGLNLHQARLLARLAQENGCITQVCHQRRSAPLMQKVRDLCLTYGPIRHAMVEFTKYDPQTINSDRDRMLDDFSHVVDTARWVCGGDVVEVDSTCQRINSPDINWINASLKFDNGSTATLFGNWTSGRRVFRVNMQGNGVCADVEPENEAHVFAAGDYTGTRYDTKEVAGSDDLLVYGGFRQKSVEFIQAIQQGTKGGTSSPFQDVVKTMEVCEIILAQALLQGS